MIIRFLLIFFIGMTISCGGSQSKEKAPIADVKQQLPLSYDFSEITHDFEIDSVEHAVEHPLNERIITQLNVLPNPDEYRKGFEFS